MRDGGAIKSKQETRSRMMDSGISASLSIKGAPLLDMWYCQWAIHQRASSYRFLICPQSFHHCPSECTQGLLACEASIALRLRGMNPNVARSNLASYGTRLIGAKWFRRVHRHGSVGLHTHIMPMDSDFFKLSPQFH